MTIVKYTSHCYYTAFIAITLILSTSSAHVVPEPSIPLGSADVSADVITDSPTKDEEPELDGNLEEVLSSDSPKEDENDRGSPGIDFLGVGYDSIFGNTLGSEDSLLDPGYRAPILKFQWRKNSQGYSPSLKALYPLNGWVRPVYSCGRSSKVNKVKNLDDFRNAFSASAQLSGDVPSASFSASSKYKKEADKIASKVERLYLHTDTCIRYQAGIPLNIPWETTNQFKEVAEKLQQLDENVKNECSAHDLLDPEAKDNCKGLKAWIDFFRIFGTHYVHQLTLGGKLVQKMKFGHDSLKKLKSSGFNVDLAISTSMGTVKGSVAGNKRMDTSKLDDIGSKTLTVIGGEMPKLPITDLEFAKWATSVAEKPVPIGISANSIKDLIKEELRDSYVIALYKYAEMNGITYETLMKLGGSAGGLMREIKNGEQMTTVNWDLNGAECKPGKKILIGFSLLFDPKGKFLGIIPCKTGTVKCNVPRNRDKIRSVSWIVCTSGLQPNINQVTGYTKGDKEEATVTCPPASVIQFGIKLYSKDKKLVSIETCKKGLDSCTGSTEHYKALGIWIVCGSGIYSTDDINLSAIITKKGDELECEDGERIIAGPKVQFLLHENSDPSAKRSMKIDVCEKYTDKCLSRCENECITTFSMALCADTQTVKNQ
ncbi:hypothetical protein BgAZ_301440 [Babesia gibsoni]|uniref:MACPF domain-containing protein n=1 Tax=Babesia gibsoni TaxID=33632 RepID=A0AAD8LP36_BABGI|nr:hypothetical protein BgAZ_301440 [Babesia gibsoni]